MTADRPLFVDYQHADFLHTQRTKRARGPECVSSSRVELMEGRIAMNDGYGMTREERERYFAPPKEAADLLGVRVSTIYRWINEGVSRKKAGKQKSKPELETKKIGGRLLITRESIRRMVEDL